MDTKDLEDNSGKCDDKVSSCCLIPNTASANVTNDILDDSQKHCSEKATIIEIESTKNSTSTRKSPTKSSKYVGVTFRPTRVKYQARIYKGNKEYNLGLFDLSADAAFAYDTAHRLLNEISKVGAESEGETAQGSNALQRLVEIEKTNSASSNALNWLTQTENGVKGVAAAPKQKRGVTEFLNFNHPSEYKEARELELNARQASCPQGEERQSTIKIGLKYPSIEELLPLIRKEAIKVARLVIRSHNADITLANSKSRKGGCNQNESKKSAQKRKNHFATIEDSLSHVPNLSNTNFSIPSSVASNKNATTEFPESCPSSINQPYGLGKSVLHPKLWNMINENHPFDLTHSAQIEKNVQDRIGDQSTSAKMIDKIGAMDVDSKDNNFKSNVNTIHNSNNENVMMKAIMASMNQSYQDSFINMMGGTISNNNVGPGSFLGRGNIGGLGNVGVGNYVSPLPFDVMGRGDLNSVVSQNFPDPGFNGGRGVIMQNYLSFLQSYNNAMSHTNALNSQAKLGNASNNFPISNAYPGMGNDLSSKIPGDDNMYDFSTEDILRMMVASSMGRNSLSGIHGNLKSSGSNGAHTFNGAENVINSNGHVDKPVSTTLNEDSGEMLVFSERKKLQGTNLEETEVTRQDQSNYNRNKIIENLQDLMQTKIPSENVQFERADMSPVVQSYGPTNFLHNSQPNVGRFLDNRALQDMGKTDPSLPDFLEQEQNNDESSNDSNSSLVKDNSFKKVKI